MPIDLISYSRNSTINNTAETHAASDEKLNELSNTFNTALIGCKNACTALQLKNLKPNNEICKEKNTSSKLRSLFKNATAILTPSKEARSVPELSSFKQINLQSKTEHQVAMASVPNPLTIKSVEVPAATTITTGTTVNVIPTHPQPDPLREDVASKRNEIQKDGKITDSWLHQNHAPIAPSEVIDSKGNSRSNSLEQKAHPIQSRPAEPYSSFNTTDSPPPIPPKPSLATISTTQAPKLPPTSQDITIIFKIEDLFNDVSDRDIKEIFAPAQIDASVSFHRPLALLTGCLSPEPTEKPARIRYKELVDLMDKMPPEHAMELLKNTYTAYIGPL